MNQIVTTGIILSRTDYGEADRILTLITPDYGKLRLVAKGVRRVKSKLAGGIELFSVSDITYIPGRSGLGTLISTRLLKHYGKIVKDLDRTMLGYDLIKQLNKVTEDEPGVEYFDLLNNVFEALDEANISIDLIKLWFATQLLHLGGHTPNLESTVEGHEFEPGKKYNFNFDKMGFVFNDNGRLSANHVKFWRLAFNNSPKALQRVTSSEQLAADLLPTISQLTRS